MENNREKYVRYSTIKLLLLNAYVKIFIDLGIEMSPNHLNTVPHFYFVGLTLPLLI